MTDAERSPLATRMLSLRELDELARRFPEITRIIWDCDREPWPPPAWTGYSPDAPRPPSPPGSATIDEVRQLLSRPER